MRTNYNATHIAERWGNDPHPKIQSRTITSKFYILCSYSFQMRRFYRQASSLQQLACQSTFLGHATRSSFLIGFALRLCIYPEHAYYALCWGWDSNPHTPITLLMTVYKTVTIPQFNVSCMWFEHILQHRKCRVLTLIRTGHTNPRLSEYVLLQFTVSLLYHIHLTIPQTLSRWNGTLNFWAEDGTQTRDFHRGRVTLYQLSYFRIFCASGESRTLRTTDPKSVRYANSRTEA